MAQQAHNQRHDISAITVNRWAHGYAYYANSLFDDMDKMPEIIERARRQSVALLSLTPILTGVLMPTAIDQAWRAVNELKDMAQLREAANHRLDAVARELLAQLGQHGVAVVVAHHVDEIDDDDAAQVAQPQLARAMAWAASGCGAKDRVVEVARPDEAASVDIDRRQRLVWSNTR